MGERRIKGLLVHELRTWFRNVWSLTHSRVGRAERGTWGCHFREFGMWPSFLVWREIRRFFLRVEICCWLVVGSWQWHDVTQQGRCDDRSDLWWPLRKIMIKVGVLCSSADLLRLQLFDDFILIIGWTTSPNSDENTKTHHPFSMPPDRFSTPSDSRNWEALLYKYLIAPRRYFDQLTHSFPLKLHSLSIILPFPLLAFDILANSTDAFRHSLPPFTDPPACLRFYHLALTEEGIHPSSSMDGWITYTIHFRHSLSTIPHPLDIHFPPFHRHRFKVSGGDRKGIHPSILVFDTVCRVSLGWVLRCWSWSGCHVVWVISSSSFFAFLICLFTRRFCLFRFPTLRTNPIFLPTHPTIHPTIHPPTYIPTHPPT